MPGSLRRCGCEVNKLPTVSIFGLIPAYAENDPPVTMFGSPPGGIFTGPGVQSGTTTFDPSIANYGNNVVVYTYVDSKGCTNFATFTVLVNQVTSIDFTIEGQTSEDGFGQIYICGNSGRHELLGQPDVSQGSNPTEFTSLTVGLITKIGGKYYLETDGITSGTYQVTFTYTNSSPTNSLFKNIIINTAPLAKLKVDNACVVDDVPFTNMSGYADANNTGATLNAWKWDFGDGFQSTKKDTDHIYGAAGSYIVKLIAYTDQQCTDTTTQTIRIGSPPVVDFEWTKICSGQSTQFEDKTVAGNSPLLTFGWDFGDASTFIQDTLTETIPPGTHGGNTTGTYQNPNHVFPSFKTYNVSLTVETEDGCLANKVKRVYILDYGTPTPTASYYENFENGQGTWVKTSASADTSWVFGKPYGRVIKTAFSGSNTWWTGANDSTYFAQEKSEVIGPCLNISNLERPMVSLNYWTDSNSGFDGAVLQYSVDGGVTWVAVGNNLGDGINWYNNTLPIASNPGNQPIGAYGWSGSSGGWKNARYNLDEIPHSNRSLVVFRVAFASSNTNPAEKRSGFAFDDVYIGEKKHNVLVEHFTTPTDFSNQTIDQLYDKQTMPGVAPYKLKSDFEKIQYHLGDNTDNTNDPEARAFYFGNNGQQLPYTRMDGIIGKYYNTTFTGDHALITAQQLDRRALEDPLFGIKVDTISAGAGFIKANIKLKYLDTLQILNSPVIVHAAIIEANVDGNMNVVRRLAPEADGIFVTGSWDAGRDTVSVPINYPIDVPISNPNQLYMVAFVEGQSDKVIYQSLKLKLSKKIGRQIVGLQPEVVTSEISDILIYPNPAKNVVNFQLDDKLIRDYQWEIVDQRGISILAGDLNKNLITPQQVDIASLANAIYFVKIKSKDGLAIYRKIAVFNGN